MVLVRCLQAEFYAYNPVFDNGLYFFQSVRIGKDGFVSEKIVKYLISIGLFAAAALAFFTPNLIFELILNAALLITFLNGLIKIWQAWKRKNWMDALYGVISLAFCASLFFYTFLPEWIIRVIFGIYCLVVSVSMMIQQVIYIYNDTKSPVYGWIFSMAYFLMGVTLLFSKSITTDLLMKMFAVYFFELALRYMMDAYDLTKRNYKWHRSIHISLPPALTALIPDFYISRFNEFLTRHHSMEDLPAKSDESPKLKAMVHIGADGVKKIGHFSFAYKGIVYSYGNYDSSSEKLFGLLGDGVYFNVPLDVYLDNIVRYEQNTIFEYGIHITPQQEKMLEEQLENLRNNSYRWYCRIEKEDGIHHFEDYEDDYPCRLHYRTGAKFYKLKKGQLKTYWVTGENCVLFADRILSIVGADILSIRGIVTPGSYFDYLQNEYQKENSPVISCTIHPCKPLEQKG